jgi:hypothetical protein
MRVMVMESINARSDRALVDEVKILHAIAGEDTRPRFGECASTSLLRGVRIERTAASGVGEAGRVVATWPTQTHRLSPL